MTAFPTRFTPFEQFMWLEDQGDYPMVFPIICDLFGDVDRETAQVALELICERHPLLAARMIEQNGRPFWIAGPQGTNKANAITWREGESVCQRAINLREESGVCVEFLRGQDRWRMAWHFHHCCCDGLGASVVMGEWLLVYDLLCRGLTRHAATAVLHEQAREMQSKLRRRLPIPSAKAIEEPDLVKSEETSWAKARTILRDAKTAWRVLTMKPVALASPCESNTPRNSATESVHSRQATIVVRHFDLPKSQGLRSVAHSMNATFNDLMLATTIVAVRNWNTSLMDRGAAMPVRIVMPTTQRTITDQEFSVANTLSYAMIDRLVDGKTEPSQLLESVRRETAAIIQHNLSVQFLTSLKFAGRWPWLLKRSLQSRGGWATAVLSNVGEVTRRARRNYRWENDRMVVGDLRLDSIYGAPPLRPGTRLSVGVSVFRQRIAIATLMDPKYFGESDQVAFLDRLLALLTAAR